MIRDRKTIGLKKAVWQVQKRWSSYAKGNGKIVKKRPEERRNAFLAYSILKDAYLAVSFFFVLFLQRSCCRTKFMQSSCCWRGREAEVRRTRQVQAICKGNFFVFLFFFQFSEGRQKGAKIQSAESPGFTIRSTELTHLLDLFWPRRARDCLPPLLVAM